MVSSVLKAIAVYYRSDIILLSTYYRSDIILIVLPYMVPVLSEYSN